MEIDQQNGTHKDPNPQVPQPPRRRFTAKYKLRILEEADRCTQAGEVGALLRREGLYSSHLSNWRRLRKKGELAALKDQSRGRKATETTESRELAKMKRENEQLKEKLRQANLIIEAQKKLSQLLETLE